MRHSAWRLPALISLIGLAADAHAEIRPRYGGKLTVEIHEAITLTDPGEWPPQLVPLVYDRLVRLDDRGQPQPALAVSWQHDRENKRWEFRLREGAKFHDGTAVTAAAVAACFKNRTDATFNADGEKTLIVELRTQVPDLPERMTDARTVILRRGADGVTRATDGERGVLGRPSLSRFDRIADVPRLSRSIHRSGTGKSRRGGVKYRRRSPRSAARHSNMVVRAL
jgi:hypothetical protein